VVINPQASRIRQGSMLAALTERARVVLRERDGADPRVVETDGPGAVAPLVREALETGAPSVIGVGGDGTIREIAAGLAGTDVPLGIVPAGTGNQVAAVMGAPRSLEAAVDALAHARPRTIDLGQVSIRRRDGSTTTSTFLLGCGAGFDAELMATTSADLKRRFGTAAYFLRAARMALRLSTTRCRIEVDGRELEMDVTAAIVGNMGQLVPGRLGLRLPLDPADGRLDLIVVSARDPLHGLVGVVDQLRRTQLGGEAGDTSVRLRGTSIGIEPLEPMSLEVDGDPDGQGGLRATSRPGALRVLAP
jgi:diacylglycerol kinase (ATP)